MKNLVVHLRCYKGTEILKNDLGEIRNENQLVKLQYGTFDYTNFLKNLSVTGFGKVSIEKVLEIEGVGKSNEIEIPKELIKELESFTSKEKTTVLTLEQKRIQDLEAKNKELAEAIEQIKSGNFAPANDELTNARKKYFDVFGKKGSPKWSVEEINQKIAEAN